MSEIPSRQNSPAALRAARAFSGRYGRALAWRWLRLGGAFAIGSIGVVISLLARSTVDYVAALAALWTVLGRTWLVRREQVRQAEGALAQEVFDTLVLDLPWHSITAGSRPAPEDLRNWAAPRGRSDLDNWYADVSAARHPVDALICQRSSLTWARQDHFAYAGILRALSIALILASIGVGVGLHQSLGDYLLRLGVPILPAALDIFDIAEDNAAIGRTRERIAREADSLFEAAVDRAESPTVAQCRGLQDQIFASRQAIGVPQWFYRLTRAKRQRNMEAVVDEQVAALPASLRETE